MRIGISTSVIQRGRTGVAQYVFALVRALLPYTAEHGLALFVLEDDLPLFAFAQSRADLISVPERWRPPARNIVWHQTQLPGLARSSGLDVLHVPSYRRLLFTAPCARVATIHDLAPFHVKRKYDWKRMLYGRVVARYLAARQDKIIAVSENTARDIETYFGIPRNEVKVIYNGIDAERFSPARHEASADRARHKYHLEQPFFLYLARLEHPGKNHVRLITAFEQFKAATRSKWQLVFGGSDWHGAEAIHAAIARSPVAADIRPLGFVPDADLPDLYRAADVFVYPSLFEGFGMPPLEAMACGCPVIASTRGSLGEVIGNAAAIVDPEEVHSITRELFVMAGDSRVRERFRTAGLARAANFSWQRAAEETLSVYKAACNSTTSPVAAGLSS